MTTGPLPICYLCSHFRSESLAFACEAFQDGIPESVVLGSNNHIRPLRGDHGLQFELDSEASPELIAAVAASLPKSQRGALVGQRPQRSDL